MTSILSRPSVKYQYIYISKLVLNLFGLAVNAVVNKAFQLFKELFRFGSPSYHFLVACSGVDSSRFRPLIHFRQLFDFSYPHTHIRGGSAMIEFWHGTHYGLGHYIFAFTARDR